MPYCKYTPKRSGVLAGIYCSQVYIYNSEYMLNLNWNNCYEFT